jgi:hypothetical protein
MAGQKVLIKNNFIRTLLILLIIKNLNFKKNWRKI